MPEFVNRDIKLETPLLSARIFWARQVNSEQDTWMTDKTKHSFWEVQLALKGEIEISLVSEEPLQICENQFVVIPPNEYHYVSKDSSNCLRFIMAFSISGKSPSVEKAVRAMDIPMSFPASEEMMHFLPLILRVPDGENILSAQARMVAFEGFLLELLQCVAPGEERIESCRTQQEINDIRVGHVLQYVRECHGIGIRAEALADRFNISRRHLNRLLLSATGSNLRDVINREKLKMIEDLISSSSLSMNEIASICEFADEYGMNKFFKRYNLISPAKYRRLTCGRGDK